MATVRRALGAVLIHQYYYNSKPKSSLNDRDVCRNEAAFSVHPWSVKHDVTKLYLIHFHSQTRDSDVEGLLS
jgi:hypothetical protein